MKFCPSCGSDLVGEGPRFCGECGAALPTAATATEQPADEAEVDVDASPEYFDLIAPLHDAHRCWPAVVNTLVISAAETWFGDPSVSTAQLFTDLDPELGRALLDSGAWEGDAPLSASFVLFPYGFPTGRSMNPREDAPVPWSGSLSRLRVGGALAELGMSMADIPGDEGIAGWWPTATGGTCVQFCQAMMASDGSEYLYWYSTPLASLGTLQDSEAARLALTAAVPSALQAMTYLAESPTPLLADWLFAAGGRPAVLYGARDVSQSVPIPIACLTITDSDDGAYFFAYDQSTGLTEPYAAGGKVDLGYTISAETSDAELARAIHVAVSTATRVANILEDGFRNCADGDMAFGRVLMSQNLLMDGADQMWAPTSLS